MNRFSVICFRRRKSQWWRERNWFSERKTVRLIMKASVQLQQFKSKFQNDYNNIIDPIVNQLLLGLKKCLISRTVSSDSTLDSGDTTALWLMPGEIVWLTLWMDVQESLAARCGNELMRTRWSWWHRVRYI